MTTSARSLFNKKKKARKKFGTLKTNYRQWVKVFTNTLLVTNFQFKTGLDYEINQPSKEILQFTKVFSIYFIFKNSGMWELSDIKEKK